MAEPVSDLTPVLTPTSTPTNEPISSLLQQQGAAAQAAGVEDRAEPYTSISDLEKAIAEVPSLASKIRKIEIHDSKAESESDADDDDEEGKNQDKDKAKEKEKEKHQQHDVQPCIRILNAIHTSRSHSLKEFSWTLGENPSSTPRPPEFWTALYAHAPSLQKLRLDFYTHEVHNVPAIQPGTLFPALIDLELDASDSHGDDGAAIEALLRASPNIEKLMLKIPGCDLETCRLKGLTWGYEMQRLAQLEVWGYDDDPVAFNKFLDRHDSIQDFTDGLDSQDYLDEKGGFVSVDEADKFRLPATALPRLRRLNMRYLRSVRRMEDWFDVQGGRRIWEFEFEARKMDLERARGFAGLWGSRMVRTLRVGGDARAWRVEECGESDEDSEDEKEWEKVERQGEEKMKGDDMANANELDKEKGTQKTADGKDKRRETTAQDKQSTEPTLIPLAETLKYVLPSLVSLRELGISLSSDTVCWHEKGQIVYPDPMNVQDLHTILSILPYDSYIETLRTWDARGEPLPQSFLDDFRHPDKMAYYLRYLEWEAKEKVSYEIQSGEGERAGKKVLVEFFRPEKKGGG